mgnify:CR=1 FL=1
MNFKKINNLEESSNLYEMNNHKNARKYSFNQTKFTFEDHQKWLKKKIRSKKNNFFVFKSGNITLGHIREEEKYKKKYLSWSIMPSKKFKGYGTKMLKKFLKKKKNTYYAFVHKNNLSSQKMSLKIGFKIIKIKKKFYFLKYTKN